MMEADLQSQQDENKRKYYLEYSENQQNFDISNQTTHIYII